MTAERRRSSTTSKQANRKSERESERRRAVPARKAHGERATERPPSAGTHPAGCSSSWSPVSGCRPRPVWWWWWWWWTWKRAFSKRRQTFAIAALDAARRERTCGRRPKVAGFAAVPGVCRLMAAGKPWGLKTRAPKRASKQNEGCVKHAPHAAAAAGRPGSRQLLKDAHAYQREY